MIQRDLKVVGRFYYLDIVKAKPAYMKFVPPTPSLETQPGSTSSHPTSTAFARGIFRGIALRGKVLHLI
jgi:hypothetical protein